jgi:hypothetical protein
VDVFLTRLYATHADILTCRNSTLFHNRASPSRQRSSTIALQQYIASVADLSPVILWARHHSTSELLRTL